MEILIVCFLGYRNLLSSALHDLTLPLQIVYATVYVWPGPTAAVLSQKNPNIDVPWPFMKRLDFDATSPFRAVDRMQLKAQVGLLFNNPLFGTCHAWQGLLHVLGSGHHLSSLAVSKPVPSQNRSLSHSM